MAGILRLLLLLLAAAPLLRAESGGCQSGCDLALGSYYVSDASDIGGLKLNLTYISGLFNQTYQSIIPYNPAIKNKDSIETGTRVNVFFPCSCVSGRYLAANFPYFTQIGDSYDTIASDIYANLTTTNWVAAVNSYSPNRIPDSVYINVTVNCSCGDPDVSRDYGLFETYPLRPGESLASVAAAFNLSAQQSLLQSYNPGVNFSAGQGIVFVPAKDSLGSYRPLPPPSTAGISGGAIAGISVAVVVVLLVLAVYLYCGVYRRKKAKRASLLPSTFEEQPTPYGHGTVAALDKASDPLVDSASALTVFTVDRSVEFSYEELAKATNEFSMANKIGEGGFGAVYYAELRGEKAAIKQMDMKASREFLAELKVLTHVHHLNLVRLIGYCTESSLFLVYEYIENGNLSEHLRGSGRNPLPWSSRVQIALDSARGLEYIHEHTVPVYIHRDIKPANILIDANFHGKVADFGLAKLTQVGNTPTRLVGTFGYMSPEYAQYGEASPKVDVFAFGVVLYELISAKEAIVRTGSGAESKGLVALFEDALNHPDPREELCKLVDPRLGDNYLIDLVYKISLLAKACTQENPQLRPSMRSIVVALMTLSSSTEEWDIGSYENQALANLMSGR